MNVPRPWRKTMCAAEFIGPGADISPVISGGRGARTSEHSTDPNMSVLEEMHRVGYSTVQVRFVLRCLDKMPANMDRQFVGTQSPAGLTNGKKTVEDRNQIGSVQSHPTTKNNWTGRYKNTSALDRAEQEVESGVVAKGFKCVAEEVLRVALVSVGEKGKEHVGRPLHARASLTSRLAISLDR